VFAHQQRLWDRVWRGGAVAISRTGPKDAVLEIVGWPCVRFPYVRVAFRGVILAELVGELHAAVTNSVRRGSLRAVASVDGTGHGPRKRKSSNSFVKYAPTRVRVTVPRYGRDVRRH
jgi:hypothetical protein